MIESDWKVISEFSELRKHEIHLFRVNLSEFFHEEMLGKVPFLTREEIGRMDAYRFTVDKIRFAFGRLALRLCLSDYESTQPEDINFLIQEFGKPCLPQQHADLKFNLSHSGDFLLFGVSRDHEIGVDTEVHNRDINHLELACSVFSNKEQSALRDLPIEMRVKGFYNCWSMKESFIKAVGLGLQIPLDQFSVNLSKTNLETNLMEVLWKPALESSLKTKLIDLDTQYSAAYTCHHDIEQVRLFDVTDYVAQVIK